MKKWYMLAIIIVIVSALVLTVSASTGTVQRTLSYNDIKITLDGQEITPLDANGNSVEPFIIDGTTYLPVRGIASALGLDVNWDQTSKTVQLSTGSAPAQTPANDQIITAGFLSLYEVSGVEGVMYLDLQVENRYDQALTITLTNMAVNDESVPLVATAVPITIKPGMSACGPFIISTASLSIDNASEVRTLIFDVEARDSETFNVIDRIADFQVSLP